MKTNESNLGLYIKKFEHKFKAKYNRAKAKQIEHKLNAAEEYNNDIEDYIHELDHRGHGMAFKY